MKQIIFCGPAQSWQASLFVPEAEIAAVGTERNIDEVSLVSI